MLCRPLALVGALIAFLQGAAPAPQIVVSAGHAGTPDKAIFAGPYLVTASWSNVALIDVASGLTVARLPQRSLVMDLAVDRAETLLAVGTCGHAIHLWDLRARTLTRTLDLQQECAESISFSPDGTLLVTEGSGCCRRSAIQVWDVHTGTLVRELARDARIRRVVFGGNGRWIGAVDEQMRAAIVEWPSGRELRAFAAPPGGISAAALTSRDGRYFGWAGDPIHIWDVTTGSEAVEPISPVFPEDAAAFLDDGRFAFVQDDALIAVDLSSGARSRRALPKAASECAGDVCGMAFQRWLTVGRDGQSAVSARDSQVLLWTSRAARARELRSAPLIDVRKLSWSRTDRIVWAGLASGIGGWNARQGTLARALTDADANTFALSPDGRRIASAGLGAGPLRVREVERGRIIASRDAPAGPERAVAVAPDGRGIAYAPAEDLTLFDGALRPVRSLATLDAGTPVEDLAFSSDGRWIAAALGGSQTFLRVYRTDGSGVAATLDTQNVTYGGQPPAFSHDSRWIASFVRGKTLTVWSTAAWNVERSWTLPATGAALAFEPGGTRLAIAAGTEAAIWNAATGQRLLTLVADGAGINAIAWSPDGGRIVTAGDDGVLRFWNAADGRAVASLYVTRSREWLLVSPDGHVDGTVAALANLVAWRTGDRVRADATLTRRARTPGLWRSLR